MKKKLVLDDLQVESFVTKTQACQMHGGNRVIVHHQCTCDCPRDTFVNCPTGYTCPIQICDPPETELYCPYVIGNNAGVGVVK